ncbi:MAG: hypothetical protein ACREBR_00955, partial [bacterium]
VYDLAHIFDGSQCIIIKQNYDKDIIIPLQYNGNYILHHTHPTMILVTYRCMTSLQIKNGVHLLHVRKSTSTSANAKLIDD